jgi:mono/diheme cytochrome c family protein
MIRAIVFGLTLLVAGDAWACSRCGIFGRGCRFGQSHVVHHQAAQIVAAPVIQPPSIAVINNYPPANGVAATLIAPQGGSVYGLSTAIQAYQLDPAAVLRQAAELTKGAQQLAQQGLQGYGQTAALALTLQASQPAITAAITQPQAPPPPQSLTLEYRNGQWVISNGSQQPQQQNAPPNPSASAPAGPAEPPRPAGAAGATLLNRHCGQCHGVNLATPKAGVYLGGAERDCKINLKAIAQVMSGKMPPGVTLSAEDRAALVAELTVVE